MLEQKKQHLSSKSNRVLLRWRGKGLPFCGSGTLTRNTAAARQGNEKEKQKNMKKLKKSAVVIPALARIAVTAAASVSGTVAWFTAAKTVTATAGSFQASYNDGNLSVTAGGWMATTNMLGSGSLNQTILSIPDGKDVTVTEGVTFTDASYDLVTDTLYSDKVKDDGLDPDEFESKGTSAKDNNQWVSDAANKVVYGVVWNYTFTYKFGADIANKYDLMFSPSKSSLTDSTDTGAGLRIALVGKDFDNGTNKNAVVFANKNYDTDAKQHISGIGGEKTDYSSLYIASGSSDVTLDDKEVSHKNKQGYLGTFVPTTANNDVTMDVRVVAWFEGTDNHVVSTQTLNNVSATLGFKVVKAEAK